MWRITIACLILLRYSAFVNCGNENSENKGSDPPCGVNATTPTGYFRLYSQNFKGECVWLITPRLTNNTAATISLFIDFIYIPDDDVVTVFKSASDVKNDSLSIIRPLRGAQNGSFTIYTRESVLLIKLKGDPKAAYQRKFEGKYNGRVCQFAITPDIKLIHSPIYTHSVESVDCMYTYLRDPYSRSTRSFTFEKFDMHSSSVSLSHSTIDGPYKHVDPVDFFPLRDQLVIDVRMQVSSSDSFRLVLRKVDSSCYLYKKFLKEEKFTVESPTNMLINSSIDLTECRWIFEHTDPTKTLGVTFDKHSDDTMDVISINDGGSEISPPLFRVTALSGNISKNQVIRTSGPLLWMAFRPRTDASIVTATVTAHGHGGYYKGSGNISVPLGSTEDPVFLLEVEEDRIVLLKFQDSYFPLPATFSIYDGFDKTNLLATLHGDVWYPVLSKSNKMMLIASNFAQGMFDAKFKGVSPSCLHMSTFSNENYILSGNCNTTCIWVVPPQDQTNTDLLLNIQFLALARGDEIKILKLDATQTELGTVSSSMNHVPQLMVPANVGALVEITRAPCTEESGDVVVVGHSSYLPACGKEMYLSPQDNFQIYSPFHPDSYPVFAFCRWKIYTARDNLVHLAFHSFKLAPDHCVKITHSTENETKICEGSDLPEDIFLRGEFVVEFDSTNCKKSQDPLALASSDGFVLNGTVSDCGSVFIGKASGKFTVPENKRLCFWKVSIPETAQNTSVVNIISYSVSKNDEKGNYELQVYDGNTVRDMKIANSNNSNIWSRTNSLIFVYKRIDVTKPSTILTIEFDTISCNATMQCDNKFCMHPDWRCNGINDCGDFSDERNCDAVPIPQYSSSVFLGSIIGSFASGAAVVIIVTLFYKRIMSRNRDGYYSVD